MEEPHVLVCPGVDVLPVTWKRSQLERLYDGCSRRRAQLCGESLRREEPRRPVSDVCVEDDRVVLAVACEPRDVAVVVESVEHPSKKPAARPGVVPFIARAA